MLYEGPELTAIRAMPSLPKAVATARLKVEPTTGTVELIA
jgi:hypothetical protein